MTFSRCAAALFLLSASIATAGAEEKAIIVLDGSGSMWGQIDGVPKITIARDVLTEVLTDLPSDLSLGLLAYGHRETGSCSDIEMMVAPAPGSASEIARLAGTIKPKGKTPLSDAVLQAATALRYTEDKATVIVITDGLETCNADPCALGRELAETGVDFTAHVVGFGLSPEEGQQVACLAEETGGRYIPADNADALVEALTETVAEVAEPAPPPPEEPPATLPEAGLTAPDSVPIGARFDVVWTGPGEPRDSIYLVDPDGRNGEGRDVRGIRVAQGDIDNRTVAMTAPVTPGDYVLQYRYGAEGGAVLAERPIAVTEAEVSLDAPPNGDIGSTIVVTWVGPGNSRDDIQLFDPAASQGEGKVLFSRRIRQEDFENRTVRMVLPTTPGFYELRYYNGDDRKVLATRQIEVLAAEVSLDAPESVDMGRTFEVTWVGPGAARDDVQIYDPTAKNGQGGVVTSKRVRQGDFDNRTVRLTAPAKPGDYQLRYFNGESNAILATRPLTVVETEVSLEAPDSVDMGRTFEVTWVGPGAARDEVQIYDPAAKNGEGGVVTSKRVCQADFDNRSVQLAAPAKPGDYQLRYYNGDSRKVLATRPLTVAATEVSVSGPESVEIGRSFEVSWEGPGGTRDNVDIFDPAAKGGKGQSLYSRRVVQEDLDNRKVRLVAPVAAGEYQLRYVDGPTSKTLAESPITVVATEVTISAPDTVAAGERFTVGWVGPGAARDDIEIVDGSKRLTSARVNQGDLDARTVTLKAPDKPGSYELRYYNGDFSTVLASQPISVE